MCICKLKTENEQWQIKKESCISKSKIQKRKYTMREEYTKKRKNQHIKLSERIKIEVGLATNQSIRSIAKQLRRSVSSISVEIKKGWYKGS